MCRRSLRREAHIQGHALAGTIYTKSVELFMILKDLTFAGGKLTQRYVLNRACVRWHHRKELAPLTRTVEKMNAVWQKTNADFCSPMLHRVTAILSGKIFLVTNNDLECLDAESNIKFRNYVFVRQCKLANGSECWFVRKHRGKTKRMNQTCRLIFY